ncbi:MAG: metallophosphatase family protein [Burkholderiaceae bacterium]|nr:metallophosphatase family protein [Burkholderiaceae bacterium]
MGASIPCRLDAVLRIGLISDTHGLLRPQALEFLAGSDFIVHAGDVGNSLVLESLAALAPLTVVRGNTDHGAWAERLPYSDCLGAGGLHLYAIHDLSDLPIDALEAQVDVVVHGHSHQPRVETRGDVLYVNPGSAGPRRFRLPIAAGELLIENGRVSARIVDLETGLTL